MISRTCTRRRSTSIAFLIVTLSIPVAYAQQPQPVVTFVFPAGAQQGQTLQATLTGKDLQNASGVRFAGAGVAGSIAEVVNPTTVRISLTVDAGAEAGERDLRLITPGGISNRLRFNVGTLPEINEVEPNTDRTQAQALAALPVLINGQILDNDRDNYRFTATAGQTLVFDMQARALLPFLPDTVPGFLDGCLTLSDATGRVLASIDRFRHKPDPVLLYTFAQDGEYTLQVSDVIYRGRADFVYRLSVGVLPYVTHYFPLGWQRNATAQVELRGVNLPVPALSVAVPAEFPLLNLQKALSGSLPTNTLPFAVGNEPDMTEAEPNDALEQANRINIPAAINGRIQQTGDVDQFLVTAKANQVVLLDVVARRLESPLDSILGIYNAQGGLLAENDDFVDPDAPLVLHHADSRAVFTFPADGDYVFKVRDGQGRGGDEYAYRLVVAPPQPDCVLRMVPDMQRVAKGDSVAITVTADRRNGFGNEIDLAVQALPPGFVSSGGSIPAGQPQTKLTITAPPDAPSLVFAPTIVGTATLNEQPFQRTAVGAEDVMQAFSYRHVVPTQEYVVAVIETSLFSLLTDVSSPEGLQVKQGADAQVIVKASRKEGAAFPINLAVVDAPAGIVVTTAAIAADQTEVPIKFTVPAQAPVGWKVNLILNGTMSTGSETATRTAPAIPIKILPAQ